MFYFTTISFIGKKFSLKMGKSGQTAPFCVKDNSSAVRKSQEKDRMEKTRIQKKFRSKAIEARLNRFLLFTVS